MTAPTYQQVQDAITAVELHHFSGTAIVVCCLKTDSGAVLGIGAAGPGVFFDVTMLASTARANAEKELARQLEAQSLPADQPAPNGATSG